MPDLELPREERILVLAPIGRDGELIVSILRKHGHAAESSRTMAELCDLLESGAGAAIITEEALYGAGLPRLTDSLAKQEPWSDLPLIILTTGSEATGENTWALVQRLETVGNVSLLERPLRSITLLSAVQVALRARRRQYEVQSLTAGLERRVLERTLELQRLNEEAEGFNYSISHDLRSPLRSIVSTSRMLRHDYDEQLPADVRELLDRQAQAANRLATLIDDLLRLSRLSRQEMRIADFDLTALATKIAEEIEPQGNRSGCVFEIQPGLHAMGDELLVRFVLLNLMENACKFSPSGGVVTIGREGEAFYVRDHGIGFDMAYSAKLFLPFERLVRNEEFEGTGIGLANVKRIVERHGGNVWAESAPGQGATFWFTLGAADVSSKVRAL